MHRSWNWRRIWTRSATYWRVFSLCVCVCMCMCVCVYWCTNREIEGEFGQGQQHTDVLFPFVFVFVCVCVCIDAQIVKLKENLDKVSNILTCAWLCVCVYVCVRVVVCVYAHKERECVHGIQPHAWMHTYIQKINNLLLAYIHTYIRTDHWMHTLKRITCIYTCIHTCRPLNAYIKTYYLHIYIHTYIQTIDKVAANVTPKKAVQSESKTK